MKDINVRYDNKACLEESIRRKLLDTGLGNNSLGVTPKAQTTKVNINKWGYNK